MADTIAAIATGTQVSAIGIIRLRRRNFRVIDRLFSRTAAKKCPKARIAG